MKEPLRTMSRKLMKWSDPQAGSWSTDLLRKTLHSKLQQLQWGSLRIDEPGHQFEVKGKGELKASLQVFDPSFYREICLQGSIGAAQAYREKKWDSPDLNQVMALFARNRHVLTQMDGGLVQWVRPARFLEYWQKRNTLSGAKKNIEAHYDLPDELFGLFLDPTRLYSCALFKSAKMSLEEAQQAKLQLIAERMDLKRGAEVLEIGSGWGGLAIFLAQQYDVRVTTTTISENQYQYVDQEIRRLGLEGKIRLLKKDYRQLSGSYDRIVSIEMIEAVGEAYLGRYVQTLSSLLREDGLCLLQVITMNDQEYDRAVKEVDFIKKFIFPGSFIPSLFEILSQLKEGTDMRLYGQQDYSDHYVLTLKHWQQRFQARQADLNALGLEEDFYRLWNYYFAYCIGGFQERAIGLSQLVLGKPLYRGKGVSHDNDDEGR